MNITPRAGRSHPRNGDREPRVSLARALSKLGYCSRSRARPLIESGAVRVNGTVCANPDARVDMDRDRIDVRDAEVAPTARVYWMVNKPRGVVTTAADEKGRPTVYDLLPAGLPWLAPVGRLDMDSEGLLLMTNDTQWANRITDPATHVEKVYHVQVDAVPSAEALDRFRRGVTHRREVLRAVRVELVRAGPDDVLLEIVLDEGRNRHIRRMLEAVGLKVTRLVRVSVGPLALGDLRAGEGRALSAAEVRALSRAVKS